MAESLHTPEAKSFSSGMNDIMKAYNSQSKVTIGMSEIDKDGNITATKDIPISALRPNQPDSTDENGQPAYSKSRLQKEAEQYDSIRAAYNKMNGVEESEEDEDDFEFEEDDEGETSEEDNLLKFKKNMVRKFVGNYIEDIPDSDEGLLYVLETIINNARGNLEMLESLYAALAPQQS